MSSEVHERVVVPASADLVYGHLAAMETYPAWVDGLVRVERVGRRRRVWSVAGPRGTMSWRVEVTVDHPSRRFGYCMEGPGLVASRMMRIYAHGATTGLAVDQVVEIDRDAALERWWGDPQRRLRRDLWRLGTVLKQAQGRRDLTRSLSAPSSESLFSSW